MCDCKYSADLIVKNVNQSRTEKNRCSYIFKNKSNNMYIKKIEYVNKHFKWEPYIHACECD